jgi:SagB-type dehydrogenase family enzyme
LRAPGAKPRRGPKPSGIYARLGRWAKIEAHGSGAIVAVFETEPVSLGTFGAAALNSLHELRTGLLLRTVLSENGSAGKEVDLLVRRLAAHGLLEYRVGRPGDGADDLIVIEPQVPGYWPRTPQLNDADALVLSRFAYFRRRGNEMVLESPRAGALFKICDPRLASLLAMLSTPQQIRDLRRQDDFPGIEFLALLVDCQIVFKIDAGRESNLRLAEGDQDLALWDFHDLVFHTRSTEGRHANPVGGIYPHGGAISPLPAVRPPWPGKKIDLCTFLDLRLEALPQFAKLLRERHSTRSFDDGQPVTLAELSRFLDGAARILPVPSSAVALGDTDRAENARPYPSAGGSWELELYLAVNICEGLPQGFYHYDAAAHALVAIEVPMNEVKALLMGAADAMGATAAPQILITIAARFSRVSWKYSSIAYSLMLKDAGVLTQTLYLMAAEIGLGGCAIGIANVDRFEKMTGIGFHIEGPVGQFAMGRSAAQKASG